MRVSSVQHPSGSDLGSNHPMCTAALATAALATAALATAALANSALGALATSALGALATAALATAVLATAALTTASPSFVRGLRPPAHVLNFRQQMVSGSKFQLIAVQTHRRSPVFASVSPSYALRMVGFGGAAHGRQKKWP